MSLLLCCSRAVNIVSVRSFVGVVPCISMTVSVSGCSEKMKMLTKAKKPSQPREINLDFMTGSYLDMDLQGTAVHIDKEARKLSEVDRILEKSCIVPGFEKLDAVPPLEMSKKQLHRERQHAIPLVHTFSDTAERERSKGPQWFNMQAPELTDELKRDLEVLQMRSALDPKHFYKKNDLKVLPKFFQVGRVEDDPVDFYASRIPRRERKKTLVDELMADADFKSYNKRRYKEIIEERRKSTSYKAFRHARRLKQKGKSRK
ncbi:deoxynucleotidyltransferase terminal-interacting protein 2 isoform X2 [Anabrus simplex]|uniref:deoxynucleotidyltransferase terminal-interacting protein 2 isoform X2 n=1 Tax=Anabrus simplex TaxID=316456 RepID=UPI0035A39BB7